MDIWSMTRPALEDWFSSRGENPAKAAIMLERLYQLRSERFFGASVRAEGDIRAVGGIHDGAA